ncbi:MAG: N-acetylmuramoyl-L-alanine amidase, partial [Hyphomonas sp.]|nr:N-acetylmuramoyl-L-alanine amidase [Hyphomonas sp.]
MRLEETPSPNHDERRHKVDLLVLHYTGMQSGQAALDRMRDPEAKVSAHYMVWEDGRIARLVEESRRAWHAGVSTWQGDDDLNSRSVGIEIVNGGHDFPLPDRQLPPYPDAQIEAVIELAGQIILRHAIPQVRIVGH